MKKGTDNAQREKRERERVRMWRGIKRTKACMWVTERELMEGRKKECMYTRFNMSERLCVCVCVCLCECI